VRVGRQRGQSPLTVRLERGSGDLIVARDVPSAASIPFHRTGADSDNGDWACTDLGGPRILRKGQTYDLRLSTDSDTQYSMTPTVARDATTDGRGYYMRSYHFRTGEGQRSSDGGRTWVPLYRSYPQNMQFYFR
jgi:hypothetical protein